MLKTGLADYGYINARVRALKSFLLTDDDFKSLIKTINIDNLTAQLMSYAEYQTTLREALKVGSGIFGFLEGVKRSFIQTAKKIRSFLDEEPKRLFSLLLRRHDLHNLKTIVRSQRRQVDWEEVRRHLIFVGELDESVCETLYLTKDLASLRKKRNFFIPPSIEPLIDTLIAGREQVLNELEDSIARRFYETSLESLNPAVANERLFYDYFRNEIDFENLRLLFRSAFNRTPVSRILEAGRFLTPKSLGFFPEAQNTKSRLSVADLMTQIKATPYRDGFNRPVELYESRPSLFEQGILSARIQIAQRIFKTCNPLGSGILLGYLVLREREFTNLRWIGTMIDYQAPPAFIEDGLL